MPVVLVQGAGTARHDTRAVASTAATSRADTAARIGTLDVVSRVDTRVSASTAGLLSRIDTHLHAAAAQLSWYDTRARVSTASPARQDTRAAVSSLGVRSRTDTRVLVNPSAVFLHPGGAVYFVSRPLRPYSRTLRLAQVREYDSAGAPVVYVKGPGQVPHALRFVVDGVVLGDLRRFVADVIKGVRHPFTWQDHAQASRAVRLASPRLITRQTGPDRHEVDIEITEEL